MLNKDYYQQLSDINNRLKIRLRQCVHNNTIINPDGMKIIQSSSDNFYPGLWPDDYLFPQVAVPEIISDGERKRVIQFLTESIIGLNCVPDRVELDGLPIMQPGAISSPHARHMPLHLPAAWVRILDMFEGWGIEIPKKKEWAKVVEVSFDQVPFSCGLAYVNPQEPCVGFGFFDKIAITGFELMSSVVLYKGFLRAARLFNEYIDEKTYQLWCSRAEGIKKNITRLYDDEIGGFLAGSHDCRQFSVWANGLAYGIPGLESDIKEKICGFYLENYNKIFRFGFTRQMVEENGWDRLIVEGDSPIHRDGIYYSKPKKALPIGEYMNGAYWPIGTGFILQPLFDCAPQKAINLLYEMEENLNRFDYPEWIKYEGTKTGGHKFLMGLSIPILAIEGLMNEKPLIEFF